MLLFLFALVLDLPRAISSSARGICQDLESMILANLSESISCEFVRKVLWDTTNIDYAPVMQEEKCSDA